jgi:hypothetical protein
VVLVTGTGKLGFGGGGGGGGAPKKNKGAFVLFFF